ncbi:L,D-transpeptidase family protein [Streptomyces sp. SID8366]|uniref:L,D-transpeptidase n=1 Tax=unclassified Streptomyces TaxID=2593676 RepID=UPI000DB9D9EE|nr:L,D-transpeptidase [Streptomyces sp. PsTaAH-130]MYU07544.1 L,D-transpeptidase family protein [Streptomyces sp. SID8366]MYU66186.1 L,D-transpeptidase family protein [Streptomyces sp. SID69]RAJ60250.1 L,D-transpeptidase-like protein [Streptomyces sp. PsTaAH-130]
MHSNRSAGRAVGRLGAAVAACVALLSAVGCSADAGTGVRTAGTPDAEASAAAAAKAGGGHKDGKGGAAGGRSAPSVPEPAVLARAQVHISDGDTVGVGMPISVTFPRPVPTADRKAVESWLRVQTSSGTTGAWSWVRDRNLLDGQRVDFRPSGTYWKPGTKITLRRGSHGVSRFTIGRSLIATVDTKTDMMTVDTGGRTSRVPITAGKPGLDTWKGTMVVMDKQPKVFMDSRTVGMGPNDTYHGYYYWALHLTTSGTYVHQNPHADTAAGHSNVTHGCVGLATTTAKGFYGQVMVGDVIKVTGSDKDTVAAGNGYGDWNLTWQQWLDHSAAGATTTA